MQRWPHAPQFAGSLCPSTHVLAQHESTPEHAAAAPHPHTPPLHVSATLAPHAARTPHRQPRTRSATEPRTSGTRRSSCSTRRGTCWRRRRRSRSSCRTCRSSSCRTTPAGAARGGRLRRVVDALVPLAAPAGAVDAVARRAGVRPGRVRSAFGRRRVVRVGAIRVPAITAPARAIDAPLPRPFRASAPPALGARPASAPPCSCAPSAVPAPPSPLPLLKSPRIDVHPPADTSARGATRLATRRARLSRGEVIEPVYARAAPVENRLGSA